MRTLKEELAKLYNIDPSNVPLVEKGVSGDTKKKSKMMKFGKAKTDRVSHSKPNKSAKPRVSKCDDCGSSRAVQQWRETHFYICSECATSPFRVGQL